MEFLEELASRVRGWDEYVGFLKSQPPPGHTLPDYLPVISVFGVPGSESSRMGVHAGEEEITVEFDSYHTHFDYELRGKAGREHAFVFIQGLQSESFAVATCTENKKTLFSWVCSPTTGGALSEYPILGFVDPTKSRISWPWSKTVYHVLSWQRGYDRYYTATQAREKLEVPSYFQLMK